MVSLASDPSPDPAACARPTKNSQAERKRSNTRPDRRNSSTATKAERSSFPTWLAKEFRCDPAKKPATVWENDERLPDARDRFPFLQWLTEELSAQAFARAMG